MTDMTVTGSHGSDQGDQIAMLAELRREMAALKADNERLKKNAQRKLTLKVSEKGALSLYGMGKFPVTLYREQWERLLDHSQEIRDMIEDNKHLLKLKGE